MQFHMDFMVTRSIANRFHETPEQLHKADALVLHQQNLQEQAKLKRFGRMYTLRNLLFRFTPGLAKRLAL
ncbi:MAG: hypothetical protein ACOY93_08740 [Bacillota bacterium]